MGSKFVLGDRWSLKACPCVHLCTAGWVSSACVFVLVCPVSDTLLLWCAVLASMCLVSRHSDDKVWVLSVIVYIMFSYSINLKLQWNERPPNVLFYKAMLTHWGVTAQQRPITEWLCTFGVHVTDGWLFALSKDKHKKFFTFEVQFKSKEHLSTDISHSVSLHQVH